MKSVPIGWNTRELAKQAGVDLSTVYRVEASGHKTARGQGNTLERLTTALEKRGVEFITDGVRLLPKGRKK